MTTLLLRSIECCCNILLPETKWPPYRVLTCVSLINVRTSWEQNGHRTELCSNLDLKTWPLLTVQFDRINLLETKHYSGSMCFFVLVIESSLLVLCSRVICGPLF